MAFSTAKNRHKAFTVILALTWASTTRRQACTGSAELLEKWKIHCSLRWSLCQLYLSMRVSRMLKTAWREKIKLSFKGTWQCLYNPNRLPTIPTYHSNFCSCNSLYVSQIPYCGQGKTWEELGCGTKDKHKHKTDVSDCMQGCAAQSRFERGAWYHLPGTLAWSYPSLCVQACC